MVRLVIDTESDGFVEEATCIHCVVTKNIDTMKVDRFYGNTLDTGLFFIENADLLICHNIISHDIPLIKKLYPNFRPSGDIYDTLLMSQILNADRQHSLEAYGEDYGIAKVQNEDWSKFTMHMLERCQVDVEINHKVYLQLQKEAYEGHEGVPYDIIYRGD